jgi:hypothetical protein
VTFDGDCLTRTTDGTPAGDPRCGLAGTAHRVGLDRLTELPDLTPLLAVTTLKSDGSWYASPTATLLSAANSLMG